MDTISKHISPASPSSISKCLRSHISNSILRVCIKQNKPRAASSPRHGQYWGSQRTHGTLDFLLFLFLLLPLPAVTAHLKPMVLPPVFSENQPPSCLVKGRGKRILPIINEMPQFHKTSILFLREQQKRPLIFALHRP